MKDPYPLSFMCACPHPSQTQESSHYPPQSFFFFFISKMGIVLMKRYTRRIHKQKTNKGDNTTAPYGKPNQSTTSIKEIMLSLMYTLTQS